MKALVPAAITSPSRSRAASTRSPLTFVPLVLPMSFRRQSGRVELDQEMLAREPTVLGDRELDLRRPADHEGVVAVEDELLIRVRA